MLSIGNIGVASYYDVTTVFINTDIDEIKQFREKLVTFVYVYFF